MKRWQLRKSEVKDISTHFLQYGIIIDKKDKVDILEEKEISYVVVNNELCGFSREGNYYPHLKYILIHKLQDKMKKAIVDMGAVPFVVSGADVMRPGIREIEDGATGEILIVIDEKNHKPLAIVRALFSAEEIRVMGKGKVLKNIHWVGDDVWNYAL